MKKEKSPFFKSLKVKWQSFHQWLRKCKAVLHDLKEEAKKQLPSWQADAHEASERWNRWLKFMRLSLKRTWVNWKAVFSTVDLSREKMHEMLFEEKTAVGKLFEAILMVVIVFSVVVVMLDSVDVIHLRFWWILISLEWIFTIIFTIEYMLRLYSAHRPFRYATSFFGILDFVTILPTYISFFVPGAHTFLVLRILRVFRIFRLLKLVKLLRAGSTIVAALRASKEKIAIFLLFILLLVTIMGSVLYIVEAGQDSGFTSIPASIYWAVVTLTTVGYGDIAPSTWVGRMISAGVMIIGYAVIAVPTGIVSAEFVNEAKKANVAIQECNRCGKEAHEEKSRYCNRCGERL